jgi:hypothetical protein
MRNQFLIGWVLAATIVFPYAQDGVAAETGYAAQVSNEREIKVTATFQGNQSEAKTWDFEVVMETHTKALNDDLAKSAVLIADGKQYLPSEWKGAPPGGHHRKGKLRFKTIAPRPAAVELQIRLADDQSPRSFKWPLK